MTVRTLRSLATGMALAALASAALAATPGEHPAVLVAKTWQQRGIDPNTFIVLHPAGAILLPASPSEEKKLASAPSQGPAGGARASK